MRKEVRIGGVIGGILVAVMIVYAIVASRGHGDKKKDQVVLDQNKNATAGDHSSAESAGSSHDDPPVTATHVPATSDGGTAPPAAPSHLDDAAIPAASSEGRSTTNWGALLSADHVEDVMPVRTHTPVPADAGSVEHSGSAAPASHMNAGDPPTHLPEPETHAKPNRTSSDARPRSAAPAGTHRVASGETFSSIARTTYGNAKYYKEIIKANPAVDPSHLRPGMVITLPDKSQFQHESTDATPAKTTGRSQTTSHAAITVATVNPAREYKVQAGDNLTKISMKLYHSPNKVDAIYQLNKTAIGADPAKLKLNMILQLPEPPTQTASR